MANTYTQLHIQVVFTVQNKLCIINNKWEDELYRYITGIVQNHHHKVLAINGMPDHVHIFIGMRPEQSISKLVQLIKANSSKWINEKRLVSGRFEWQAGFGAFSYSKSHVDTVIQYILNQKHHHKTKTFIEEYIDFLNEFQIPYDDRYIFKPVEY